MNKERMTSSTASTRALPHPPWGTQAKSPTCTVSAFPYVNLGFGMIDCLHLEVIVKVEYCMFVEGN